MADSIITPTLIALDADLGADKSAVITALAGRLAAADRATDAAAVAEAASARESQSATGLPGGIAIPHCRSAAVSTASLAFARLAPAVDFGAPDGPADQEDQVGGPVGGAEVDGGGEAGEGQRRRRDGGRSTVGDRDAAGEAGGRLRLPGRGGLRDRGGIGGAVRGGESARERGDHRALVGAEVGVQCDQGGSDDRIGRRRVSSRSGGGAGWAVVYGVECYGGG